MLRVRVRSYSSPHSSARNLQEHPGSDGTSARFPDRVEVKVSNSRIWLFRILVVAGAALLLVAWFMPWWTIDIEQLGNDVMQIRPWGLETQDLGGFAILLKGTEMPAWFSLFMWTYLVLCLVALLVGLFVQGKELRLGKLNLSQLVSFGGFKIGLSQVLIAGVGFSYIVAAIVAAVYASMRMGAAYNVPLQGRTLVDLGDPLITYVETRLLPGYYLTYVVGAALLVLGLLQGKITGEPKSNVHSGSQGVGTLGHSRA